MQDVRFDEEVPMFKDKMYQELRDDLEICERHRLDEKRDIREEIATESILCSFLRKEKETDIRLVLKRHRLAIKEAKKQENKKEYEREIDKYCKDVFEYLEQNSKQFKQEFDWYCKDILGEIETHQRFDEIDKLAEKILEVRKDTSRKDSYVALQEAYLDYQLGKIDNQDMLKKAREVFTSNRKYQVTRECKEVLKDSHGMLDVRNGLDIAMIVKELLMAVLVAQAKAFLYDAGYPSFDKRKDKTIETDVDNNDTTMASVKNKGRRQDQVIDLVELYLRKKGRNVFREETDLQSQTSDYRSEEFKKRCLFIYDTIQEEGRDDVCIPMYINQNTGAGIYIIGKKWFDNTFLRNSKKMWEKSGNKGWDGLVCHFCSL